jgi:hypothetical protein
MRAKKPYSAPQLVRVELNHEQAILSVCSLTAGRASAGTTRRCRSGATRCKRSSNTGDNAGRPS